jgi:hypothetical protein
LCAEKIAGFFVGVEVTATPIMKAAFSSKIFYP